MKPVKILVVDDEPDQQFLISRKFKKRIKPGKRQFLFADFERRGIRKGIAQGREQGLQQGLQQGLLQKSCKAVIDIL